MSIKNMDGLSGRDLQASQSGGESGEYGGNMEQDQAKGMIGGAPSAADREAPGGSSGTGGYGQAQAAINPPGGEARRADPGQSRGEAFDEAQGGGRGPDSVSDDEDETDEGGDPAEAEFDEEQG